MRDGREFFPKDTHTARASWLVVFELLKMKWMMLGSFEISQFLFALRFGRCFFVELVRRGKDFSNHLMSK